MVSEESDEIPDSDFQPELDSSSHVKSDIAPKQEKYSKPAASATNGSTKKLHKKRKLSMEKSSEEIELNYSNLQSKPLGPRKKQVRKVICPTSGSDTPDDLDNSVIGNSSKTQKTTGMEIETSTSGSATP